MTWQRVMKRNGLEGQDYGSTLTNYNAEGLFALDPMTDFPMADPPITTVEQVKDWYRQLGREMVDELRRVDGKWSMLAGDMARLAKDATDEQAICAYIATRTGVDAEVVAAVLKEFIAW